MAESYHDRLGRVRPPRVQIKYEVYVGDAVLEKELPFVVGVLGDFSGKPTKPLKDLDKRDFVYIDRDNFDDVMASMNPALNFMVPNVLTEQGGDLNVSLEFKEMKDFDPARVAEQIGPLKKLLESRNRLRDLMTQVGRPNDLGSVLEQILKNPQMLEKLKDELGKETKPEGGA